MTSPLFIVFFVSSLSSSVSPFVPLLELEGHEVPVRKMRRGRVMMYRLWINKMVMMMMISKSHGVDQKNDGADEGPLEVMHGAH